MASIPFQGAFYGPGYEPDANQRKQYSEQCRQVIFLRHFGVDDERQWRGDQVPEGSESPACVHCGFGTRFDDRCLPLVVRQPGGVDIARIGQVFFFRRTKNENDEAQSDTTEGEQKYRFETDDSPA